MSKYVSNKSLASEITAILEEQNFNQLPKFLYEYRWNNEASKKVVNAMISFLTQEKIEEIYNSQKKGLSILSRLLASFNKVYLTEEDKQAVHIIAQHIVDVSPMNTESLLEISLLAYHLYSIDKELYEILMNKIVTNTNLVQEAQVPFASGFLPLVKQLVRYAPQVENPIKPQQIFGLPFEEFFFQSSLVQLNQILWELLQIDKHELSRWIRQVSIRDWVYKVNGEPNRDAWFRLVWILQHIDQRLTETIAQNLWRKCFHRTGNVHVPEVPLVGWLMYYFPRRYRMRLPDTFNIANYLSNNYTLTHIAFAVYLIDKVYPRGIYKFRSHLSRYAYFKNPQYTFDNLINNYPINESRGALSRILGRFQLTKEPNETFQSIERVLVHKGISFSTLTFEEAVESLHDANDYRALFRDEELANTYVRLFFQHRGWTI